MTIRVRVTLLFKNKQLKTKKKQHLLCINENKRIFLFIFKFIDYREKMKIGFTLKPRNGNILDFENQVEDLEETTEEITKKKKPKGSLKITKGALTSAAGAGVNYGV